MENKEIRYAIVIGINDYMRNPLDFCVKDAIGIRDALVNDCMFEEKNIFVISSSEDSSEKDITGKYLEALRKIKTTFVSEQDSLLFYFAGHGSCKDEKSVIWSQPSVPGEIVPIEEFYDYSAKYLVEGSESIIPARIGRAKQKEVQRLAISPFRQWIVLALPAWTCSWIHAARSCMSTKSTPCPASPPSACIPRCGRRPVTPELMDRLIQLGLERHQEETEPPADRWQDSQKAIC